MPKTKTKNNTGEANIVTVGYMPCFEYYVHAKHPIDDLFKSRSSYLNHIRGFINGILDCKDLPDMKNKTTGKEIKPIRAGSDESIRVNKIFKYPYQLYRVDYGDNALRLYFGFSQEYRLIDIVAIDINHTYFN